MVWFSERQSLLLQLLSEVEQPLIGHELAALLGVSPRTLRYDIARVNRSTGRELVIGDGKGYHLDRSAYQAALGGGQPLSPELGNEERMLLYLLDHPVTDLYDIVVDCYTGESVVRSTLRRLKPQLESRGVTLLLRGSQVRVVADEWDLRRLLGRLVHRAMDAAGGNSDRVARHLPDVDLRRLEQDVRDVLGRHDVRLDDIRLENLVITLAICLQRAPYAAASEAVDAAADRAVAALADLAGRLARQYPDRPLVASDLAYLADLVRAGAEAEQPDAATEPATADDDVRGVLIEALDDTVAHFNLTVQRDKLYSSLEGHVRRMLGRVGTMLYFRNSLQESLRSRSPFLYDVAVYLAERIVRRLDVRFTDDEIGLLAIYFGLYSEHRTPDELTISAALVCPRYQTLRDWLIAGLVERYEASLRVVDIVATGAEAADIDCDLVITTLEDAAPTQAAVQVSAVLSDLDMGAIDAAIARVRRSKSRSRTAQVITRFLDPALFFVGPGFEDRTQTITFLSRALEAQGIVPPEFVDSALLRETYSSTAFAHRFAIPHAMSFMAHETKVAVLIPAGPIDWEVSDVTLVLMLAIDESDYDDFVAFYQPLVRMLYDPQFFADVRRTTTFEEFRDLLGEQLTVE